MEGGAVAATHEQRLAEGYVIRLSSEKWSARSLAH